MIHFIADEDNLLFTTENAQTCESPNKICQNNNVQIQLSQIENNIVNTLSSSEVVVQLTSQTSNLSSIVENTHLLNEVSSIPSTSIASLDSPMSNVSNTDVTYENNGLSSSTSTDTNTMKKRKRKYKKKKDLGRTRKVFKSEWKDVKRKSLKNLGLSYVSRDGKEKPSKSLSLPCGNSCRLKCTEKIPNDLRQLFDQFWSLGNRVRQWKYLANCCEKNN